MPVRVLLFALFFQIGIGQAEETDITVRVIARNAQYVGDLVDGAFITITDATSGEMLAQGKTSGSAGNPESIMRTPRERGAPNAAAEDASFSVTLDIDRPRYIQVTAYGPLDTKQVANRASATQWIVPGKHLSGGDGWVLELPGLLVTPNLSASSVPLATAKNGIRVEAEVMLMCGCLIKPDFYWIPSDYEVVAVVHRGKTEVGRFPLNFTGSASEFETQIYASRPGVYDISVYAYDSESGNTGVGQIEMTVTDE